MRDQINLRKIASDVEFSDTYWYLSFEFSHDHDKVWSEAIEYVNVDVEGGMSLDRSGDSSIDAFYPWLSYEEKKTIHDKLEAALAEILARETPQQKRERRKALLAMVAEINARYEVGGSNASGERHA
ncbi:hypothetical protein ACCS67_00695 [Rhizobium brockwellii]|uniref:hypothetical protein n=1 Tax=Rhizobium brockwellii TaxID=3019932 RepID=UPI003F9638BE